MTEIQRAAQAIRDADALLIGASNGLSIAEGYHIFANNEMFRSQFADFQRTYGIRSIIEGCFFPFPDEADRQRFLTRLIEHWVRNYCPSPVMKDLLAIVGSKDYFILTSNADTHLELSGFAPDKVFEVEGTFEDLLHRRPMADKRSSLNDFLTHFHARRLLILELGIGSRNRLIKLPLMQLAAREPQATYITLNLAHELYVPDEIADRSIALAGDMAATLCKLRLELEQHSTPLRP